VGLTLGWWVGAQVNLFIALGESIYTAIFSNRASGPSSLKRICLLCPFANSGAAGNGPQLSVTDPQRAAENALYATIEAGFEVPTNQMF